MQKSTTRRTGPGLMLGMMLFAGAAVGIWSAAAFVGALGQANWQVGELLRQYMVATGLIREHHTLVDFYTHIKGVEYIICAAFFVAFPMLYKYLNNVPVSQGVETQS